MAQAEKISLVAVRPATDWETAIAAFCFSRKVKGCTDSTIKWYHDRLARFANYCQNFNETPSTFSRATVFAFFASLQQRGVTPQTINGFRRALSAFCAFLRAEGFRDDDPLWGVAKLKEPVPFPRTLSDAQLDALLAAPDVTTFVGLRDYTLILLLADNGLRINEALSLTLDDIDLQNGFVFVRHAKGGKQRQVPLSHNTALALRRYLAARFAHFPNISTRALFITEFGFPLRDQSFRHRLEHYAKKAGITGVKVSPHSLRFTFIRRWLAKGGDSIILQRIVGHSSPAMVSYYAKLFAQDLKSVHAKVNPLEGLPSAQKRLLGISGKKTRVRFTP